MVKRQKRKKGEIMFDELTNENIRKTKRVLKFIGRFLRKYLTLLLFSIYVFQMPVLITKDPILGTSVSKEYVIIGIILEFLMFYSVTRLVTVYNEDETLRFINSKSPINTFSEKISFIFGEKENIIELSVFALLFILLPFTATVPCLEWLLLKQDNGFIAKSIFTIAVLGVFLIIYILGYFSAMAFWDTKERRRQVDYNDLAKNEQKQLKRSEKAAYRGTFAALVVGYFLGSIGIMFIIPAILMAFSPLLLLFLEPEVYVSIILIIVIPPIYRHVRAYRKRKQFIKELKELCRRKRYVVSKVKDPFKSLFRPCDGESFNVRIGERKYSCKLIASQKRSRPLYIMKNGIGGWLVTYKFISIYLFSYTKTFNFGWESDNKKVLIVNPVPQQVLTPKGTNVIPEENAEYYLSPKKGSLKPMFMKTQAKEFAVELDNCDIVDGYEFYTATGFLNALERDVIDKDL